MFIVNSSNIEAKKKNQIKISPHFIPLKTNHQYFR